MLKGLGALGDMGKLMQQAQEMQAKMAEAQASLEEMTVQGEAGAGLVKVNATAKGEIKGLDIDPSILVSSEKEVVEDLILAALRDAQEKAQAKTAETMGAFTEGLGLPPGMKLPF